MMATVQPDDTQPKGKRKKKERFIKRAYHGSERDGDARRKAAKRFLSQITLDGESTPQPPTASPQAQSVALEVIVGNTSRGHIRSLSNGKVLPPIVSTAELAATISACEEIAPGPCVDARPAEQGAPEGRESSPLPSGLVSRISSAESPVTWARPPRHDGFHQRSATELIESIIAESPCIYRALYVARDNTPLAMSTVLMYTKHSAKNRDHVTIQQLARTRLNSATLQLEMDTIQMSSEEMEEVSLSNLLDPVWVVPHQESCLKLQQEEQPVQSPAEGVAVTAPRISRCGERFFLGENYSSPLAHERQLLAENHTPITVIENYTPCCLDNHEYFVGKNITTLTPQGYRVSIIQYTKPSDRKRLINDRFRELFPHISLPLTRLRSSKSGILNTAIECGIDLAAVAYAYTYFEKVVLMGKVNKGNRRIIAGVCLLLAVKFYTDAKKQELRALIEKIMDLFRISSRELFLHEFPVLLTLQFSLVTPSHQVQEHYNQLITPPITAT
ncbi:hypothetical protein EMCRGX_G033129 [Ephydatia muelleri]|eukprot:Em0019g834a